ncbi:CinA family protein [Dyadobacter sp.]|uniref:CinA family protein n=1 Tax=Dyadobacter sp. TaxID=1914288 RepID=UPI003F6F8D85
MPSQIVIECGKALAAQKLSVAFAESATAGRLAAEFSLCAESGTILKGGLVCYDALLKQTILHVPSDMIQKFTPESAEVTQELANRLQSFIPADVHIGVTGLTCPGGSESPEKPVGTMFVHAYFKDKSVAAREVFKGSPEEIMLQCIDMVARLILQEIPRTQAGE